MDSRGQKRRRMVSLRVTFDARSQDKENRGVAKASRRAGLTAKEGRRTRQVEHCGRPPVWQDRSQCPSDVAERRQERDAVDGAGALLRRSRRHVVVAQRMRTNPPVSKKPTAKCNDAPLNDESKRVRCNASKFTGVVQKGRVEPLKMVLRDRGQRPSYQAIKKRPVTAPNNAPSTSPKTVCQPTEDYMMELVMHVDRELSLCEEEAVALVTDELSGEPYAAEILKYLKDREDELRPGMGEALSCEPLHRLVLVDWLIDVQNHLDLELESLHLGVALTDAYLRRDSVGLDYLQLVGITCFFLACKCEEVYYPELKTLCDLCAGVYTSKQLLAMERKILQAMGFNIVTPTSIGFLELFLTTAGLEDKKLRLTCHYLLELMLLDYNIQLTAPSLRAAAALYVARLIATTSSVSSGDGPARRRFHFRGRGGATARVVVGTKDEAVWTPKLAALTGYRESDLGMVVKTVLKRAREIPSEKYKAVFIKYCNERRMSVSFFIQYALNDNPTIL